MKMIDPSGNIYWSVSSNQEIQSLFQSHFYVIRHDDGRSATIVVTDTGNRTLTLLDGDDGSVINRRQVKGKKPFGVTSETDGNVYVCYY